MVSAAEAADRLEQHSAFIDSAAEAHLAACDMTTTILRGSFYLDFLPELAVDGVISGPAGPTGGSVGAAD